jgi:hypothetical protein
MQPDAATLDAAKRALAAVSAAGYNAPTYVRVDGVICAGRLLIMELEMIEPFLFLHSHAGAAGHLAQSVVDRLRRTGRPIEPAAL